MLLIVLVVSLALAYGCCSLTGNPSGSTTNATTSGTQQTQTAPPSQTAPSTQSAPPAQTSQSVCLSNCASLTSDTDVENCKLACCGSDDSCIKTVAEAAQDSDGCLNISTSAARSQCVVDIAKATQNTDTCSQTRDWNDDASADNCIKDVAFALKDTSYCSEIHDSNIQQACMAAITK